MFSCRGLLEVFKLILEHTEHIGEQRIKLADSLISQISEVCKAKKKDKETSFKKVCIIYNYANCLCITENLLTCKYYLYVYI